MASERTLIAGVDEAGRGPLAGPVVVAAVVLHNNQYQPEAWPLPVALKGLDDSKRLSARRREALEPLIMQHSLFFNVQVVDIDEIDSLNILQATMAGMQRAVEALDCSRLHAVIDGNRTPDMPCPAQAVVGGDALMPCISAASVLAKVHRDRLMLQYHQRYPAYGFDRHKGYPTRQHLAVLSELGPCPIHRRSFGPVKNYLQGQLDLSS